MKDLKTFEVFTENHSYLVQGKTILGVAQVIKYNDPIAICIQEADKAELLTGPKVAEVRAAFADFYAAKGCGCCGDHEGMEKAGNRLGELLGVEKYDDDSGYDFWKYRKGGADV